MTDKSSRLRVLTVHFDQPPTIYHKFAGYASHFWKFLELSRIIFPSFSTFFSFFSIFSTANAFSPFTAHEIGLFFGKTGFSSQNKKQGGSPSRERPLFPISDPSPGPRRPRCRPPVQCGCIAAGRSGSRSPACRRTPPARDRSPSAPAGRSAGSPGSG